APTPNTCLTVPSDRVFSSLAAARCDLYTTQELRNCQSVCEINGTVFHRDPTFSGIVGPAAPPSLALSADCVQQDNRQWTKPPRFADLVTFYNESSKRIGVNFNSNDGDTRAFVFQCFCENGLSGIIALDGNTITANGCEQVCLGEVNNDYDGNSPRQKGYYYILIISPTEDKYNLSIIPEGPCGANIIPLQCGVAAGGSLSGEDNTFPNSFPAAYQNYSGPRTYTGRDKVYSFSLQRPQHIDLSLTANRAMGFFLYTDQCGTNPILYRETPTLGGTAQLDSFFLPAATYFLVVDEVAINTVSKYTLLLSSCSDGDVNRFLPQFSVALGTACLSSSTSPHTVSLGASVFSPAQSAPQPGKPAIRLNDLVQFKYKDGSGQERTSAFQFWNGVSLDFPLPADAPGDPKCGYRAGDSLQMAIQHYDNGASQYINYQLTPVSGNPAVYQAGGSTSVAALKALRKPAFFKVNPLILNPSHKGEDYKVRGRSSDFDWTVSEHEAYDWISIPEPGGEAKTEYDKKIVFEPNTGTQPREAKLLFRSTSTHPDYKNFVDTVRIIQRGTNCAVPTAATITTSPASPCAGREFTLTAAHSPANPYYEYQWGHGKTGSTIKEIAPDLGGAGNIGYSLTVFDRACGLASAAQTLSVPIGASTAWVSTDTPTQGNLINGEKSGTALARFGDWVALGSPEWNASANVTKAGRVLLYKRTAANTWTFKQQLNAPTQAINEFFGYALSMQGDLLLVGAPAAQNGITVTTPSSTKPGAAYLFRRNADDTWSMTGNKMTSGSTTFDNFGTAVALQGGEYAFVGADAASSNKVCIFHRDEGGAGTWGRLSTSLSGFLNGTSIGRFGCSLAADGEYLAVGAKNTGGVGAVFIFEHAPQLDAPHLWGQVNALQVPAGEDLAETDDRFGHSVALRGNYLLVGAPYHDNDNTGSNSNRGAAWLYERDISAGWKKVRKILPSGGTPA
ncbi:MAG TPA: hypothetical protein PK971_09055, partial [Saprospiraceae bacterium]|nr:hypothetical protein [Saprospiraceae bacterium]